MVPARAQLRCVAAGEGSGWADMPGDLLAKVLEELEVAETETGVGARPQRRCGWCAVDGSTTMTRW
jgi:hypothetical protein